MSWFDDDLFEYLADLADNNERAWFQDNRERYERSLKDPALRFIADAAKPLATVSPHMTAIPKAQGGSLFRIYRDTRFSKDKTPYKTHLGIQFKHARGKDVHAPGYYLHIEPGESFFGAGTWHPDSDVVKAMRAKIDARPDAWRATKDALAEAGLTLGGDSLKRVPRGYDKDHPLAEDLKRKDYIVSTKIEEDTILSDGLMDRFITLCQGAAPLMRFLCDATDVEF